MINHNLFCSLQETYLTSLTPAHVHSCKVCECAKQSCVIDHLVAAVSQTWYINCSEACLVSATSRSKETQTFKKCNEAWQLSPCPIEPLYYSNVVSPKDAEQLCSEPGDA